MEFNPETGKYDFETFSRKKREYLTQFNDMASEITDAKQLFAVVLKSHELFLNLVEVIKILDQFLITLFTTKVISCFNEQNVL